METFSERKGLLANPHYLMQRDKNLCRLAHGRIDAPIVDLIKKINQLPYCFTLQCCYGHFVSDGRKNAHHLESLPVIASTTDVTYRIAYIAFCIDNCTAGRRLLGSLPEITAIDPQNIQFGCAEWFWEQQVNSYVLQVEPDRFKHQDTALLDFEEARHIEKVRNAFFVHLDRLIDDAGGRKEE